MSEASDNSRRMRLTEVGGVYAALYGQPLPCPYRRLTDLIYDGAIPARRGPLGWGMTEDQVRALRDLLPQALAVADQRRTRREGRTRRQPEVVTAFLAEIEAEAAA